MTTLDQAIELGLNADEYNETIKYMKRIPNITELGIFSAMWSEHCSYKSSKFWSGASKEEQGRTKSQKRYENEGTNKESEQ